MQNSNKETKDRVDNDFFLEQKSTPTIIELKGTDFSSIIDAEYFKRQISAVLGHVPEFCLMCSNHQWKLDGNMHYMGRGAFKHHLKSAMGPEGQRLYEDLVDDMYSRYRKIVDSFSRKCKNENRPRPNVIFTIGVLA